MVNDDSKLKEVESTILHVQHVILESIDTYITQIICSYMLMLLDRHIPLIADITSIIEYYMLYSATKPL